MKLSNGYTLDRIKVQDFTTEAQKRGINAEQLQWLLEKFGSEQLAQEQAAESAWQQHIEESYSAAEKTLRDEWGATYEEQLGLAKRGARRIAGQDADDFISAVGNSPAVIRAMVQLGRMDGQINAHQSAQIINKPANGTQSGNFATPAEARGAAHDIIHDKNHPEHAVYWNPQHPNYTKVHQKVMTLFQTAHPEPAPESSAAPEPATT